MLVESCLWLLAGLIIYTYIGYPVLLFLISTVIQGIQGFVNRISPKQRQVLATDAWPSVAVVIAAYNEEKHIVERIHNLLSQDYPVEQLKIYIGSDGSQDNTVKLVRDIKDDRIVLFDYAVNRGKVSVVNDLLVNIKASIVVFTDANAFFRMDALKQLTRHFAENKIAGVCGELNLITSKNGENKDGVYWRLEKFLKFHESKIDGFLGANGAIYAIKRDYCQLLPVDTIIDDFTQFMNVALAGHKIIYDPEAVAEESIVTDMSGEYERRVRIGAGNYQAFFRLLRAFHPKHQWRVFTYISHKVIRWFTPHCMALLLILNLFLLDQFIYLVLFIVQISVYLMVLIVVKYRKNQSFPAFISLPVFLITMNVALGHGFIKYLSGNANGAWKRTER